MIIYRICSEGCDFRFIIEIALYLIFYLQTGFKKKTYIYNWTFTIQDIKHKFINEIFTFMSTLAAMTWFFICVLCKVFQFCIFSPGGDSVNQSYHLRKGTISSNKYHEKSKTCPAEVVYIKDIGINIAVKVTSLSENLLRQRRLTNENWFWIKELLRSEISTYYVHITIMGMQRFLRKYFLHNLKSSMGVWDGSCQR